MNIQLYDPSDVRPLNGTCIYSDIVPDASTRGYKILVCDKPARAVGTQGKSRSEIYRCDEHRVELFTWVERSQILDVELAVEDGRLQE